MSSLEHHYRKLLRWYPADHRRRHEDEMLGVLLASAEPGQERPGLRDRADLLLGAVEIRLSRSLAALTGGWGDALALVSVIAPVLLLGRQARDVTDLTMNYLFRPEDMGFGLPGSVWDIAQIWSVTLAFGLIPAVIVVAALRHARVTAAVLAWTLLGIWFWLARSTAWSDGGLLSYETFMLQAMLIVTALALTVGPGPVRGLELISRRRVMLLGAVSAAAFILDQYAIGSSTLWFLQLVPPVVFAVIGGLAMGRPATRRAAAILAAPTYAALQVFSLGFAGFLPHLLLAITFLAVAAWTLRRSTNSSETPVAA